jgi:hypothetical protein
MFSMRLVMFSVVLDSTDVQYCIANTVCVCVVNPENFCFFCPFLWRSTLTNTFHYHHNSSFQMEFISMWFWELNILLPAWKSSARIYSIPAVTVASTNGIYDMMKIYWTWKCKSELKKVISILSTDITHISLT